MFTGLIETLGTVRQAAGGDGTASTQLTIATHLAPVLKPGDSVAVNGVCLTVARRLEDAIAFDVSLETHRMTALYALQPGSLVNLERPLQASGSIGGHFVQGHIDATGILRSIVPEGDFWRLQVGYPGALAPFLVMKGSIAVDGISLTIARLNDHDFEVVIVPFTWEHTNLHAVRPPVPVNLECDILGKYVQRFLACARTPIMPS